MSRVILIGEPMAMFIADIEGSLEDVEKYTRAIAGAEINVSIGLKRLEHEVSYVTKLGEDPFGRHIAKFLSHENIDTSHVMYDKRYSTGFQLKSKVSKGDPEVVYFRKGSAASNTTVEDIDRIDLSGYDHIHITGIFPALSMSTRRATYHLIDKARENGMSVSFDPNLRPMLWKSRDEMVAVLNDIAQKCDMVLPGINEGLILTEYEDEKDIAGFYLNRGIQTVVVKLGSQGAYVRTQKEEYYVLGFKVEKVLDTVGAGDGFAVGVISGLLEGNTLRESVLRGNAIGALQVMSPGDNDGLPTREKLFKFMKDSDKEGEVL